MSEIKLINLIRYTIYQSFLDDGKYSSFQTVGDILSAQELLEESK